MAELKEMVIRLVRRLSGGDGGVDRVDAMIRVTSYGVEVELADGLGRTFLQSELDEPSIEVGLRWAREQGAVTIRIGR